MTGCIGSVSRVELHDEVDVGLLLGVVLGVGPVDLAGDDVSVLLVGDPLGEGFVSPRVVPKGSGKRQWEVKKRQWEVKER